MKTLAIACLLLLAAVPLAADTCRRYVGEVMLYEPCPDCATGKAYLFDAGPETWSCVDITATALVANGANCAAGNYPLGVDASGAVEDCTAVSGGSGDVTDVGPGCATGACLVDGTVTTGTEIFTWEGTAADGNEYHFTVPSANPGADLSWGFPTAGGTLAKTADTAGIPDALVCTDCVALGSETTGNYAGSGSEGGAATTATALAADPANCAAKSLAAGVNASGTAEGCAPMWVPLFSDGWSSGITLAATAGTWTTPSLSIFGAIVDIESALIQGGLVTISGGTHRCAFRGQRTTGAGDVSFRLYDLTNSQEICSVTGITAVGFTEDTSMGTLPSGDAQVVVQYKADAATTGTLFAASWWRTP